jgi:carbon monoxide dehydrogenase subunit G
VELTHRFTVPAPLATTWAAFNDIESVAGCFPGAAVTGVEGDEFTGTCKVKLGPIALVYSGSGRFTEKDEAAGRFAIEAKGKDKRGNGTAGADVTASLTAAGDGSTDVEVVTDLHITGKPAQFGRGVMQDVSDKLLQQFVTCLEQRLQGPAEPAAEPGVEPSAEPAAQAPGQPAEPAAPTDAGGGTAEQARPVAEPAPARPRPPGGEEALDLGTTVLPVLAKAYWKQALGVLLVLLVLRRLLRRR